MEYILSNFTVIQPTVIVVYGDPLAKCFMNRFSEGVVKVRILRDLSEGMGTFGFMVYYAYKDYCFLQEQQTSYAYKII